MEIKLPYSGIVLLIGPSNSGKSTQLKQWLEKKQILPSEVVSSDDYRILISDMDFIDYQQKSKDVADALYEEYQQISKEAFLLMDALIEKRSKLNKTTFVDATHLHPEDRKRYREIAQRQHVPITAILFDIEEETLLQRDELREKPRGKRRIKQQYQTFKREKRFIKKEAYQAIYVIKNEDVELTRKLQHPLHVEVNHGIDVIGDIHACYDELIQLLEKLGYRKNERNLYTHSEGRKFLSLGDIMSRGPKSIKTMQFFLRHIQEGLAYMIDSNHGWKIARWLEGKKVTLSHGDEKVAEEFHQYKEAYGTEAAFKLKAQLKNLLLEAPSHYILTKNGVPTAVCTHAGIKDEYIGKQSHVISDFCRYGDSEGLDGNGKPIRKDWTIHHQSSQLVIWGHDSKLKPLLVNNTINIDQGAVFGGELTAYRYPEKEFVSVKSGQDYSVGDNPLIELKNNRLNPPSITKFLNGFTITTEIYGNIKISKEYAIPALDTISHYTIPIEELVYIPPTMSPSPKPSLLEDYLEHPREVIDYYRRMGVERMVAEKKHMGSRGILLLFKNEQAGLHHVGKEALGVIYTRAGRRFFAEEIEKEILYKLNQALLANHYFESNNTEFVLLDAEIMPWNLKAKELISSQYAHVAENAILDRTLLTEKLKKAAGEKEEFIDWLNEYEEKLENAHIFREVFQKYCWNVEDVNNIQIAPFHILAHSNQTFFHKPHTWHMKMNRKLAEMTDIFVETEFKVIEDTASEEEVIKWWTDITEDGHEGIVIKPDSYITSYKGKLVQPAIKVRGRKYLHIIYGMDYLLPDNLARLKNRNTSKKQKLALQEFSLGVEGIQRFVNEESIERVHECVLATIAMEADPVDPRL